MPITGFEKLINLGRLSDFLAKCRETFAEIVHTHAAGDVTSGEFSTERIPSLPASKIGSGTIPIARGGTNASTAVDAMTNLSGFRYTVFSSPDLDDLTEPGVVAYVYGTLTNAPFTSFAAGWVATIKAGSNSIYLQLYWQYGSANTAARRSMWMRVYNSDGWGAWYELPSTAKDSASPSATAATGYTVSSCTGQSRLGAAATVRLQIKNSSALASGSAYVVATLAAGWRPPVAVYGDSSDYRDVCWLSANGEVTFKPGRAISADSTSTMSFTFVLG